MPERLAGFDGSIKDEKASNVAPAGIDIAAHRVWKRDSETHGNSSDTSIL